MAESEKFTKYEKARILGARALQIAMNAPLLIKIKKEELEKMNFDALRIAEVEFSSDVLPITVNKPMPKKKGGQLKRVKAPKVNSKEKEKELEEEIAEDGEIMELANPDDEESDEEERPDEE